MKKVISFLLIVFMFLMVSCNEIKEPSKENIPTQEETSEKTPTQEEILEDTPTQEETLEDSTHSDGFNFDKLNSEISKFKDKINNSNSYMYKSTVDVYEKRTKYSYNIYKESLEFKVNNINNLIEFTRQCDTDKVYGHKYKEVLAVKGDNVYCVSQLKNGQINFDFLTYYLTCDEYVNMLESEYRINFTEKEKTFNIECEKKYSQNLYEVKYKLDDFMEHFSDPNITKFIDKMGEISSDAFVLIRYVITEDKMAIYHTFDYDGVEDLPVSAPCICFSTQYEITSVDLECNMDTIQILLRDIDSDKIDDATNFKQVYISVESRTEGYFKVYLDKGEYKLTLNAFHYPMDPNSVNYEIYDSNKQKIEKGDSYNLESGYYYVYVNQSHNFPIIINKLS